MISGLDHIVILVSDIDAAAATYQTLFALKPSWRSSADGAETVQFTFENMSVELLAPSGDGAAADRIRAAIAEGGEGLASLCFRVVDIARMHRRLDRLALKPEAVTDGQSRDSHTGASQIWKRTRAVTDATYGVRLFFLERVTAPPRSDAVAAAPVIGLDHVVIATHAPERAAALYGARLGLDMALDRSHPEWGRLMFFRCSDLIVEVVHRPGNDVDAVRDKLWGLSWRVADLDEARDRMCASGIDVTEPRSGRKPGTRVATARSGTCGIPTLLIERSPRST